MPELWNKRQLCVKAIKVVLGDDRSKVSNGSSEGSWLGRTIHILDFSLEPPGVIASKHQLSKELNTGVARVANMKLSTKTRWTKEGPGSPASCFTQWSNQMLPRSQISGE